METRGGRNVSQAPLCKQKASEYDSAIFRMQALPLPDPATSQHPTRGGADHDMASRDFDDDQLFSMIMELDMAAPGEDGGMHSLDDSLMEQGAGGGRGSGAAGGNSAGDEDDDRMHPPRVTGARSTRGRAAARRKGRAKDEDAFSEEEDFASEDDEGGSSGGRGGGKNKRVMANRQSAQRSRMRKLQFISDLEHSVARLQADIKGMNPQLAALRARHDGLAAEHDGMRAHAVTLVQKCRQAESVNGALQRECSRLRGSMHLGGASALGGYDGYGGGRGNYNPGLQSIASAPAHSSGYGMPFSEPSAFVSSAGVLQMPPAPGHQETKHCHSAQQSVLLHSWPASAPSQQHYHEGAGAYNPMYNMMYAPEPLAF